MLEDKLKQIIIDKYGSVRQFAIKIDIPYTTIDSILKRGINNSNVGNVLKICQSLNISLDSFLENNGEIIYGFEDERGTPIGAYELNENTNLSNFKTYLKGLNLSERQKEELLKIAKNIKSKDFSETTKNNEDENIDALLSAYKDLPDIDKEWVKNMVIERRKLIDKQLENKGD